MKYEILFPRLSNNQSIKEWEIAVKAHERLKAAGIHYSLVPGDHDYPDCGKTTREATSFTNYFPPKSLPWYSWDNMDYYWYQRGNSYCLLQYQGNRFLILNLEFLPEMETLSWAQNVCAQHPYHYGIIISHGDEEGETRGILPDQYKNIEEDFDVIQDYYNNHFLPYFYGFQGNESRIGLLDDLRNSICKLSTHGGDWTTFKRSMEDDLSFNYQTECFYGIPGPGNYMQNGNGWLQVMTFHHCTYSERWKYTIARGNVGITLNPYSVFQGGIGKAIHSHTINIYPEEKDTDPDDPDYYSYKFFIHLQKKIHNSDKQDKGWSTIESYTINGTTYFFLLHEQSGIARLYSINPNGSFRKEISHYYLGPGWSSAISYTVRKEHYLFLSSRSRNSHAVHNLNNNGELGPRVATHSWNPDWNHPRFFYSKDDTYLFFLMKDYSHAAIYLMNPDGSIGTKIDTYKWYPKFNHTQFYTFGGITYLLLLEAGTGELYVYEIKPWGKIGNRIATRNIGPGWKWMEMYSIAGNNYLYLIHQSGRHAVYRIDQDGLDNGEIIYDGYKLDIKADGSVNIQPGIPGDLGACVAGYIWDPGWVFAKHYTVDTHHYMLFYHPYNNRLKVHPLITEGYKHYLNSLPRRPYTSRDNDYLSW
jgi:hypothetical protein